MSKFKVGDWVRFKNVTHMISKITEIRFMYLITTENGYEIESRNLELWQPQVGEWCWYNHGHLHISPTLVKYSMQEIDKVEPFIGELPILLRSK